ncbi:MAG TPA: YciI family protein [Chloroflexota bacterium]|nr:YciI family protein [Chloroflexota bacterium]
MKFMVLLTRGEWQESGSQEERERVFGSIQEWWGKLSASGQIVEGHQLQHPQTATTVIIEGGQSLLVDRPLIEAKEAIGGYAILEAADLDAALAVVRTFPMPDGKAEVRAVVER